MPNLTEQGLREYVETFHATLSETASSCLPESDRSRILHISLLPATITGYVSTQFGVAVEYELATTTSINVVRGSARVEDLLVQAPHVLQNTGPLIAIPGSNIVIHGLHLKGAFPFRLTSENAAVTLRDMLFSAGPWQKTIAYAELKANRAAELWSRDQAALRAKDEVLAAMVELTRAQKQNVTVGEYIAKFKDRTVLVLGAYDEAGIKRLDSIASSLTAIGYSPLLIRDIPDHPHQDLGQKVSAVGAIARFILIDDTEKSGHLMEAQICKQNAWVTVVLRAMGHRSSWMTAAFSASSKVLFEYEYDPSHPEPSVAHVCEWAEETLRALERTFTSTYPWRQGG